MQCAKLAWLHAMVMLSYMVVFSTLFVHYPFSLLCFRRECVAAMCLLSSLVGGGRRGKLFGCLD